MNMNTYEGMFLVEPTLASTKWNDVVQHIKDLVTKHGGKVLQSNKWAERKLAYTIRHQKRGTYVLTYFEAPTDSISKINADCKLSEIIMRAMILAKPPKVTIPEDNKKTLANKEEETTHSKKGVE